MVENGSIGGAQPLPPNGFHSEPHAEFLELCAIATTGYLSEEEQRRLDEHLPRCAQCRERLAQYEAVIAGAIPALAAEPSLSNDSTKDSGQWRQEELDKAEHALFARLKDEKTREGRVCPETREPRDSAGEALWRHVWWQYAAGLLLSVAFGAALYKTGIRHGTESAKATPAGAVAPAVQGPVEAPAPGTNQMRADKERASDAQIRALRTQLDARSVEVAKLEEQQVKLTKEVADGEADRTRLIGASDQAKAEAARQVQQAQANLDVVQKKLDAATAANEQETARAGALEARVGQLTDSLHGRDQELAREQELLDHDRDIRELMGSRDLYIAEVYDVAKTGDTKKPFGRVFYTKAKSLIFYAYDLDQQAGVKDTSTFQVWGRRGPDEDQAVNLGILYQDNASKKRWVMKADNAKTLAGIDAVFVTVEPKGRSQHPSGKALLFAYLKMEPNHP